MRGRDLITLIRAPGERSESDRQLPISQQIRPREFLAEYTVRIELNFFSRPLDHHEADVVGWLGESKQV